MPSATFHAVALDSFFGRSSVIGNLWYTSCFDFEVKQQPITNPLLSLSLEYTRYAQNWYGRSWNRSVTRFTAAFSRTSHTEGANWWTVELIVLTAFQHSMCWCTLSLLHEHILSQESTVTSTLTHLFSTPLTHFLTTLLPQHRYSTHNTYC